MVCLIFAQKLKLQVKNPLTEIGLVLIVGTIMAVKANQMKDVMTEEVKIVVKQVPDGVMIEALKDIVERAIKEIGVIMLHVM